MRRVLIVEDNPSGHRLVYVRHLARYGLANGWSVTVAFTPAVRRSEQHGLVLGNLDPAVDEIVLDGRADLAHVAALSERVQATLTIVPDGDDLALRIGAGRRWRGHGELSLLAMRDPDVEVPGTSRRRALLALKALLFRRVDRARGVRLLRLRSGLSHPVEGQRVALDPVEIIVSDERVRDTAAAWGVAPDRFWFSVIGALGERKNVPLVAEALAELCRRTSGAGVGLLLAGQMAPAVREAVAPMLTRLRDLGAGVITVDRLLTAGEVDSAIALSDCVVAAHALEAPSGVVATAGAYGTRVLAAGARSLQRDAAALPAGRWCPLDVGSLATTMAEVMEICDPIAPLDLGPTQFCSALFGA